MSETVNQENIGTETELPQERTFTQAEVDNIIKDRLTRERGKFADYEEIKAKAAKFDEAEEASKSELQKAIERAEQAEKELTSMKQIEELRAMRAKVAEETGVPASLLTADSEEGCRALAEGILAYKESTAVKPVAPVVRDAGEANGPTLTKADILAIKNDKERVKAIEENIELFKQED